MISMMKKKPNWPETRKMKNLTPSLIYVGCIVLRPTEFDLRKYQQKDGAAQSLLVVQWQKLFRSRSHHCSPGISICPDKLSWKKDSLRTNRDPCCSLILCKRPNYFCQNHLLIPLRTNQALAHISRACYRTILIETDSGPTSRWWQNNRAPLTSLFLPWSNSSNS